MKKILVGYTGFVGSNISSKTEFDGLYNSKNIEKSYGEEPDLLIYSGVPAQKFIANKNPDEDLKIIKQAINNIEKIKPKKLVLISTIDIYENPNLVDEDTLIEPSIEGYGRNRLYLENWVKENIKDYHIIRLPGLYGENIKKNFIYDLINIIPSMLKEEKFEELKTKNHIIENYYNKLENGFYKCIELNKEDKKALKKVFIELEFTALNFTDSRSTFQFYNLSNLWNDINIIIENNIKIMNLATEPIKINELYKYIYDKEFINELNGTISNYNFKTKYFSLFKGENGYIKNKDYIIKDIKKFVTENMEEKR